MFNKTISELKSEIVEKEKVIAEKEKEIWDLQDKIIVLNNEKELQISIRDSALQRYRGTVCDKEKIAELKSKLDEKDAEIKSLKQQLNGEKGCADYCSACEHGILIENIHFPSPYANYNSCVSYYPTTTKNYICALNAKCKDFKRIK